MILWIFAALSIGLIAAFTARAKGRPFKPWLAYGTLLGVVALPHALLLRDDGGRDDGGRDDDDGREADGLFGFNPMAGRRAYPPSGQEEPSGWDMGELPPDGLVMRAPEPEVETDVAPVWSEDDFARIAGAGTAGDGRTRRARVTAEKRRESRDAAFGAREASPPAPETGPAPDEPTVETTEPREGFPEATSGEGRPLPPDRDISPEVAAGTEPEHADDQPPAHAAASVESEAARVAREALTDDVESSLGAESSSDPQPPPEPSGSGMDIPLPPPAFGRRERSRKAFGHPRRMRRSRLWDDGAAAPADYRQEPHFEIGRDEKENFEDRDAVRIARRFAPHHGADDARRMVYEDRPERSRLGLRHVVAAVCVLLVVLLAWSRFGGLWAPRGTDVTPFATPQVPDVDAPDNVSSVPVVPPKSPGEDTDVTVLMRGDMPDVPPDTERKSVNKKPSVLNDEVPMPPPVPAARARLETPATSSPANTTGMETVPQPPRKPASTVSSGGEGAGDIQEGKGEISATGDLVARIQAELRKRGYDIGSVDGRAGTKTRQAIVAFKRDNGLSATSGIDDALIERLGIAGRRLYPFTPPGRRAAQ